MLLVDSYKWQSSGTDIGLSLIISDLGHGTEMNLSNLIDNIRLGRTLNTLESKAVSQRDLDKL